MKSLVLAAILAGSILSFTACANKSADIFVGISTDKVAYPSQEPIAMAVTILNQDSKPGQFALTSSQVYDFYLYDGKELIWKWSADKMFAMSLRELKLEPGKPLTYVVNATPLLSTGQPLKPGKYRLVAVFCAPTKLLSKPLELEIR